MNDWRCPSCETEITDGYERCWRCGTTPDGQRDPHFSMENAPQSESLFCAQCEYSLQGLDLNRCPECGRAFDRTDAQTVSDVTPAQARHNSRLVHLWLVVSVFISVLLIATWYLDRETIGLFNVVSMALGVFLFSAPIFAIIIMLRALPRDEHKR